MSRPLLQNSRLPSAYLLVLGLTLGVQAQKPGTLLWKFHHPVASSPAIGTDGTVYIGSFGGWVSTAILRRISSWKQSPLLKSGSSLFALDGKTGKKKWEFETEDWVTSSPAIGADGTVYFGSWDGIFYAVHGSAGPADSAWPMFGKNAQRTGRLVDVPRRLDDPDLKLLVSRVLSVQGQITIQAVGELRNPLETVELEFSDDLIHWQTQGFQLPINLPLNFPLTQDVQFMRAKRIRD